MASKCNQLEAMIRNNKSIQRDKDMQMKNMESHLDRLRNQAKQLDELEQQYVNNAKLQDGVVDEAQTKVRQLQRRLEVADDHAKLQEKRIEELLLLQNRNTNDEVRTPIIDLI